MKFHTGIFPVLLLFNCLLITDLIADTNERKTAVSQSGSSQIFLQDSVEFKSGRIVYGKIAEYQDTLLLLELPVKKGERISRRFLQIPYTKIARINGKPFSSRDKKIVDRLQKTGKRERFYSYPNILFELGYAYIQTPLNKVTDLVNQAARSLETQQSFHLNEINGSFSAIQIALGVRIKRTAIIMTGYLMARSDDHKAENFELCMRFYPVTRQVNIWITGGVAGQSLFIDKGLIEEWRFTWRARSTGFLLGAGIELVSKETFGFWISGKYLKFPRKQTSYFNESQGIQMTLQKINLSSTIISFGARLSM